MTHIEPLVIVPKSVINGHNLMQIVSLLSLIAGAIMITSTIAYMLDVVSWVTVIALSYSVITLAYSRRVIGHLHLLKNKVR